MSNSGLLFKLKSIHVGGSVLSIHKEFLSNRRQSVVVDDATSEWTPIISGMPQGNVLCSFCIPVKCLSWQRTDYMPILMTPYYWQLFASQQTELLLLPPLND